MIDGKQGGTENLLDKFREFIMPYVPLYVITCAHDTVTVFSR